MNADFACRRFEQRVRAAVEQVGQVTIGIRKKLTCFDAGFTNANQSCAFAPARRSVGML